MLSYKTNETYMKKFFMVAALAATSLVAAQAQEEFKPNSLSTMEETYQLVQVLVVKLETLS